MGIHRISPGTLSGSLPSIQFLQSLLFFGGKDDGTGLIGIVPVPQILAAYHHDKLWVEEAFRTLKADSNLSGMRPTVKFGSMR